MYYLLKNPVKLKKLKTPTHESTLLAPSSINYKDIFSLSDKRVSTGLTEPYPETLAVINNSHHSVNNGFLISDKQLDEDFIKLYQVQQGDKITLLKDSLAHDSCWNQPAGLTIPKGTKLVAREPYGTRRGDYFFEYDSQNVNLKELYCPHPESMPILVPEFAEIKSAGI